MGENHIIVDGVLLDDNNTQFFYAAKMVLETESPIIYLTGKAGTGKTTFLKYICQCYTQNLVVLAPTGIAAVNAGGQTIHSFFKLGFSPYLPEDAKLQKETIYDTFKYRKDKVEIIKKLSLIIIDEISMVRCDILDAINKILQTYRKQPNKPFGGVRMLLIGDTFQLPPITKSNEWNILKEHYRSPYFFNSKVYENSKPFYIQLEIPYRQTELEFLSILDKIRINNISESDLNQLNSRVLSIKNKTSLEEEPILLAPINYTVDKHNTEKFEQLTTDIINFPAIIQGDFPSSSYPVEKDLRLRIGAQVMIVKNYWNSKTGNFEYYNGNIGIIQNIENDQIQIGLKDKRVRVEKTTWENLEYHLIEKNNGEKSIEKITKGTFTQFPIKLAWAITINKSQGLTFDSLNADLSGCFNYGQVYVALSRCKRLNGLYLQTPITKDAIKTDPRILEFAETQTPQTLIIKEIEKSKADNLYKQCRYEFEEGNISEALKTLENAVKVRDDRDTPLFHKYLNIILYKSKHYKQQALTFHEENKKLQEKLNTLMADKQNMIIAQDYTCKEFENQILTLKNKNNFLNHQLQEIKDKLKTNELETVNLKNNLQTQILIFEQQTNMKDQKIATLIEEKIKCANYWEEKNKFLKTEIERLNSITWWQKLRGKK